MIFFADDHGLNYHVYPITNNLKRDTIELLSCQPRVTVASCFVYNCLVKH